MKAKLINRIMGFTSDTSPAIYCDNTEYKQISYILININIYELFRSFSMIQINKLHNHKKF